MSLWFYHLIILPWPWPTVCFDQTLAWSSFQLMYGILFSLRLGYSFKWLISDRVRRLVEVSIFKSTFALFNLLFAFSVVLTVLVHATCSLQIVDHFLLRLVRLLQLIDLAHEDIPLVLQILILKLEFPHALFQLVYLWLNNWLIRVLIPLFLDF